MSRVNELAIMRISARDHFGSLIQHAGDNARHVAQAWHMSQQIIWHFIDVVSTLFSDQRQSPRKKNTTARVRE